MFTFINYRHIRFTLKLLFKNGWTRIPAGKSAPKVLEEKTAKTVS